MNTSLLEQELAPLNAQIEQTRKTCEALEAELHVVETELEKYSAVRQRFDALRDVCNAFDRLGALKGAKLFWEGLSEADDAAAHLQRVVSRVVHFDDKIGGVLEKQSSLQTRIDQLRGEMDDLYEDVRDAHEREARRQEEFILEREISPVAYRAMVMPWTKEAESERAFRRAVLVALLLCFVLGAVIHRVRVPEPDRSVAQVVVPERLAMLVKKEPPKPAPQPKPEPKKLDETKPAPEPEKPELAAKAGSEPPAEQPKKAVGGGGSPGGSKKAQSAGVLAFKHSFADLMKETPIARLGTEASLMKDSPVPAGQAVAQRSLVAMQGSGGTSGGISNFGVSRNVGSGGGGGGGGGGYGIGMGSGYGSGDGTGSGFAKVKSAIAGRAEAPRALSDGPGGGRTDEEIQIVFDRYKAALYRIYNSELRKDPTLRGKILLRISIEPDGAVSMCKAESTDLASPALVAQIIERVKRFNFGSKNGVPKTSILYPIDFLPAG